MDETASKSLDGTEGISYYDLNIPIHQLFEEQVKAAPDLPCVVFQERKLSYNEVNERSNIVAWHMKKLGIESGDSIAVALKRSENLIVAILAILKLDCTYIPVDLSNPLGRLQFIFGDAEPTLTIGTVDSEDLLRSCFAGKIMFIADAMFSVHEDYTLSSLERFPSENYSGENIAYIIYTSGSTGNPKGVCCTHKGLVNRICWMRDHYQIGSNDKVLHKTPIGFDVSLWELFLPLISGACLIIAVPEAHKDNQAIFDLVERESVTVIHFVPSMFRAFLQSSDSFDSCVSLRYIFSSGESLSMDIAKLFFEKFTKFSNITSLHNLYGPTEAAIDVSFYECSPDIVNSMLSSVPIGKPIINTQLYILDEYLKPLSSAVPGELFIGGVGLAKEYLKRPDLTREYFLPNPFGPGRIYRTGDIVILKCDGNIEFLGRKDTQVKLRGYRIELGEIEMNLMKIPGVANAAVIVREDLIVNSKVLVGYVQKNTQYEKCSCESEKDFVKMLQENLAKTLPSYMIPSKYVFLENFPLTLSGKLDRKALPKPITKTHNSINDSHQSRTEMENILANIWCEVMGLDQLGLRDNFFQIGGDSIISMQIRSRAKDSGVLLSVRDIFDYPTIQQLSIVLDSRSKEKPNAESQQNNFVCESFGKIPLTPVQCWFFEQNFENINFWNQYIMVKPNVRIEQDILYKALEILPQIHAILNVRFVKEKENNGDVWIQNCFKSSESLDIFVFIIKDIEDISSFESEEQKLKLMEEYRFEAEKNIDIQSGVLWGVVLFEFKCDNIIDQRLLFFAHHLIMDGVSLRVVMTDLENVYRNMVLGLGNNLDLGRNSTSFRNWSFILLEHAKSREFLSEIEFWENVLKFSKEFSLPLEDLSWSATQSIYNLAINEQATYNLIHKANSAYRTEINDILLTAFVIVISEWTGKQNVCLELEGHGREEEINIGNSTVDLTKTVGWFTSMFPVCLQIQKPSNLGHCLKMIKEQLRKIPQRGISYGILKYLKKPELFNDNIKEPDICFNYLGQFDNVQKSNNHWSVLKSEDSLSKDNHLHKSIIVDSSVCEGVLKISWRYKNCISLSIIENLAKKFSSKLEDIVNHCCDEVYYGYSPSDFLLLKNNLNQEIVDENFGHIRGIVDILPLSPMQLGMYFQNCFDPQTDSYLVQKVYEIKGDLKVEIFEESWKKIVNHYNILRTGYKMINGLGIPVQFVLSSVQISFKYLDWSENEKIDTNILFRKCIFEDRQKLFCLKTPPLMRIMLVKISQDHFLLLWTMHHLILDGWSTDILYHSLLSCYGQLLSGKLPEIMYLPSFREHISWIVSPQRENRKGYEYFANYLQAYFPKESLTSLFAPLTRRQLLVQENDTTFDFDNVSCKIQENLLRKLKERASVYQVTLSTVIEFAWGLILSRFTGENDIIFGLTISGRSEQQNHDVVGLLINTLPVRLQFDDSNDDIGGQLTKLQTDIRKLEEFSYILLAEVQSASLKYGKSGPNSNSLFDTILIFENYPVSTIHNENGFDITCTESIETTEYPLTVSVTLLTNGEMNININYKKKYFLSKHIQSILHSFHSLLEDITASREKSWKGLNILSDNDRKDFLTTWKGEILNLEGFSSVIHLIFEKLERMPNSLAIIDGDRKVTYKELMEGAIKIAIYLKSCMVDMKGKPFVIIMERSLELIFAIVTVFLVGGVYIPVDPSTPESRIKFILDDTQAICILTVRTFKRKFEEFKGHVICLDESLENVCKTKNMISREEISESSPSDNAYIIYTSGSTGNPKGCLVKHENLTNYLLWARKQYCTEESSGNNNLIPLHSSISFDLSITSIFLPLISGKTILIVPDSFGIIGLLDVLRTYEEFSLLKLTPSHLDIIYEAFRQPGSLPKVQCLILGGENLLTSQILRWRLEQPETKIFNEYGPTECTVGCTAFEITVDSIGGLYHSIPIGNPIANTSIYVLDKKLNIIPQFVVGELYVGGKGVTSGYLNLPDKTKENFIKNPFGDDFIYSTGDTVRYSDDSGLEYLGRSDRQIKLRGYRIEPGEIECILRIMQSISEAVVVSLENELIAFVISKTREISKDEIISKLKERLPKHMIPSKIIFLENLPISSSGKVDMLALHDLLSLENSVNDTSHKDVSETIPSFSELEAQLALIWKEILDVNRAITKEDNFFQLGGHSLTALRFVHLTKTRLGISFPLSKIFETPTVKELAFYIEKLNCPIHSLKNLPHCIVTVNGQGTKTPLFLVHSGFGFATEYLALAELDVNRPIYGINSRRFSMEFANATVYDENTLEFRNIEEMAACYVEDILSARHDESFIVGGWSFGGVVAVEMAHILKQKGKEVELVLLLDSFNNKRKSDMEKGNADIEANFPTLSADEKSLIYRELESNCRLLKNHVVKHIPDQQVVLIKAQRSDDFDLIDDHNGWKGVIPMLKVIDISTHHYDMFQPNDIKDTIIAIQRALENFP